MQGAGACALSGQRRKPGKPAQSQVVGIAKTSVTVALYQRGLGELLLHGGTAAVGRAVVYYNDVERKIGPVGIHRLQTGGKKVPRVVVYNHNCQIWHGCIIPDTASMPARAAVGGNLS